MVKVDCGAIIVTKLQQQIFNDAKKTMKKTPLLHNLQLFIDSVWQHRLKLLILE